MLRKLLIVDDNAINRELLNKILCNDYEVLMAENGVEALEMLRRHKSSVAAVLLDIIMPVMDGYEVLKSMHEDDGISGVPVIVTTSTTEEGAEIKALSLGANDFIMKPYNPVVIKHKLENTIALRETAAGSNLSGMDKLTGLYSRIAFFEKSQELIASHKPGYYVMACFDVDNFKVINDQYGSIKGDAILKQIADVFRSGFESAGGICCRIMADKFAVLYPVSFMDSDKIADIRNNASILDSSMQPISFSIGRYIINDLSLSVSAMYDRASMAKASVKSRFDVHIAQYDESMRENILREQEIISEMNSALMSGQFEVWLQPQYNHSSNALIGSEALVRWRHPKKGIISPSEFIPIFEDNGFIYEMDKYVWEKVCILLRKWMDEGKDPLPISVNVSRRDVFREDLIDVISGLIEKYDIPIGLLRLEITESAFAKSTEQVNHVVNRLLEQGFIIEIDDFGSGYSSLNTLKDVPANMLKLDMRFLENNENSTRGGNILGSIVRMAKWLGIPVIAEGVETKEQADYLLSIGCSFVQGHLYARPMPISEYEHLALWIPQESKARTPEAVKTLDNEAFWDPLSIETLVFNNYAGGACIFEYYNGKTELLRVNKKYAQELGENITLEEALALSLSEHMDDANKNILNDNIHRAIESDAESTCEICLLDLADRKHTYLRTTVRVIAEVGERILLYGSIIDITKQKECEQKLLDIKNNQSNGESVQWHEVLSSSLNAMMISSTDLAFIKDKDLNYICCTRTFAKMVGLESEEDILGKTDYDLFDKELAEQYRADDFKLLKSGKSLIDILERIPSEGASSRYSSTSKYLLYNAAGKVIGLYGVGRDVTSDREAYAQLKLLTDNIPGGLAMYEISSDKINLLYFNDGFYTLTGYSKEEYEALASGDPLCLVFKEDMDKLRSNIRSIIDGSNSFDCVYRTSSKDGSYCWINLRGTVSERNDDRIILNTIKFDITEQKLSEENLRINREEYRLAISSSGNLLYRYSVADKTLHIPLEAGELFGHPDKITNVPESLTGTGNNVPESMDILKNFCTRIRRVEKTGQMTFCKRVGDVISHWFLARFSTVFDNDGKPVSAIIMIKDVTDEKAAELSMKKQAETDGMTGLYNKTTTETLIRRRLSDGDNNPFALLIIDLDELKSINDNFGHVHGDEAIRYMADSLRSKFRNTDIIGRVGGDEFLVFLDGVNEESKLHKLLTSFMKKLSESQTHENKAYKIKGSIGVVAGITGLDTYDTLFKKADKALYHVKQNGKNNFAFYSAEMDDVIYK